MVCVHRFHLYGKGVWEEGDWQTGASPGFLTLLTANRQKHRCLEKTAVPWEFQGGEAHDVRQRERKAVDRFARRHNAAPSSRLMSSR